MEKKKYFQWTKRALALKCFQWNSIKLMSHLTSVLNISCFNLCHDKIAANWWKVVSTNRKYRYKTPWYLFQYSCWFTLFLLGQEKQKNAMDEWCVNLGIFLKKESWSIEITYWSLLRWAWVAIITVFEVQFFSMKKRMRQEYSTYSKLNHMSIFLIYRYGLF